MNTAIVWLLFVMSASNGAPAVVERFDSRAECERTRAELVEKITSFTRHNSACVAAKVRS